MREALSGLTLRGRAFLAAGITAIVCAVVMGQDQLIRVGVLVAVLPLLAAALIGRSRYRLALVRTVTPQLVERRLAGHGDAGAHQRGPQAQRAADARGPRAVRPRHPAPLRARGDRHTAGAAR